MTMIRNNTLLVDSGFFFALFNPRDQYHADACEKQDWLEELSVVVPWPILYETVNTRFIRRPATIVQFESILLAHDTVLLDDSPYRLEACGPNCRVDGTAIQARTYGEVDRPAGHLFPTRLVGSLF